MADEAENLVTGVVLAFNEALNARDLERMVALLTPSSVFENTYPAPDGTRFEGLPEVKSFWEEFFKGSAGARIEVEEIFAAGKRCTMRWKYHWRDFDGKEGYIRGVDVYTIEDGKIAEKLSYVKG